MAVLTEDGRVIVRSDVTTKTYSELDENEIWHVKLTITQGRLIDGEDKWETESVSMTATAKDLSVALANASVSIDQYLFPRNYDLFTKPKQLPVPDVPSKTEDGEYVN
jgi:hypothetical protein